MKKESTYSFGGSGGGGGGEGAYMGWSPIPTIISFFS